MGTDRQAGPLPGAASPQRIALFADSFLEVNGVAHTCRMLAGLAESKAHPFFLVHGGPETRFTVEGAVTHCQLRRGPGSFAVDRDFRYDLFFYRHCQEVEQKLRAFAPTVIHITGPGDAGTLGLVLSRKLRVPLCASWHTNLHEYAGRRLEKMMPAFGASAQAALGHWAETAALRALGRFYRAADTVMAPNRELLDLLSEQGCGPGFPMRRGVDTALYTPARRRRSDAALVIGYVGRLTVEKNIYFLRELDRALSAAGVEDYRFLIVGDGAERAALQDTLRRAEFTGVLRGEALAEAYAGMDLFVFPSHTDTFGNVVLEALSSGVPAIVTADGGPKYIVRSGETGFVADTDAAFVRSVLELANNRTLARRMGLAARRQAVESTWDAVWGEMLSAWAATRHAAGHSVRRLSLAG